MEKKIINTLMDLNGYNKFICDIFQEWEFVKDEMLLPERKTGSGNGTVHIYLQSSNLSELEKCFPKYFSDKKRGVNINDKDCPIVEHYCYVPNLLTLASNTYQYFSCNDSIFNLIDYTKEVLSMEQDGFIKFDSIFKLSTDNRPYFKQFSKKIFSRTVRSLFIGDKSAYKISLYQNTSEGTVATFWQIAQTIPSEYIINQNKLNLKDLDKTGKESSAESAHNANMLSLTTTNNNIYGQSFRDYLQNKGKKPATIDNYLMVLNDILPRLICQHLGHDCETLFSTVDYKTLLELENVLWICPQIRDYDEKGHRQLSAAYHRYLEFAQSLLSDEELADVLFK